MSVVDVEEETPLIFENIKNYNNNNNNMNNNNNVMAEFILSIEDTESAKSVDKITLLFKILTIFTLVVDVFLVVMIWKGR